MKQPRSSPSIGDDNSLSGNELKRGRDPGEESLSPSSSSQQPESTTTTPPRQRPPVRLTRQAGSRSVSPNPSSSGGERIVSSARSERLHPTTKKTLADSKAILNYNHHNNQMKSNNNNDNNNNNTESTPLLYDTKGGGGGTSNNEMNETTSIGTSISSSYVDGTKSGGKFIAATSATTTSTTSSSWNNVKDHLDKGNFIMYKLANTGNNHTGSNDDNDDRGNKSSSNIDDDEIIKKNNNRRTGSSKKIHIIEDEIRSGITFTPIQCIIAILLYLTFACICYDFIFEPNWGIIDAAYFAVTTFTTVGYGNIAPTSHASMIFTSIYAFLGIACLGIALGVIGSNLVEKENKAVQITEQLIKFEVLSTFDNTSIHHPSGATLVRPLSPTPTPSETGSDVVALHQHQQQHDDQSSIDDGSNNSSSESNVKTWWLHFVMAIIPLWALVLIIGNDAGWNLTEIIYFLVVTSCTIGYGDLSPDTPKEKLLAIFYIPIAVAVMGHWLGLVANYIIEGRSARLRKQIRQREMTLQDLESMDTDGDGRVSRAEFLEFMLLAMDKVDKELINELREHFNRWDATHSGELSKQDLVAAARRKLKSPRHKLRLATYKEKLLRSSQSSVDEDYWGGLFNSKRNGLIHMLSEKMKDWKA